MASARFAWGIDVGNRALKAIKLVREGDTLRVDDFEVIEHETVLSNAGDNKETLIQSALANFIQRHPIKGGVVAVGVSGQSSFARFIKLPPVEERKIPEIVRFEAIQQIPFPLDDVEWSYQLFRSPESPDVEVGIFAMRKELVNQHIKYFTDLDLNVQTVQMNPLAVYNAMYHDNRLDGTTMIVDLGAENTDLIIADADTVWMRSIPIGGNSFTETLVKSFKLNFQKAEELKRNAATSKYARQIFQAMRPIFADLVAEIQRSIGFYASTHRDSRIKRVMAIGGTFKLPGLQKYLQQNLQLDVERLDSLGGGPSADSKLAPMFSENVLSVVSAYGLAIQAMGDGKITSSLLPAKIRREKLWKEKTKWFAAAAALFVAGSTIPLGRYFVEKGQLAAASADQTKINSTYTTAKGYSDQWATIEGSGADDRARIANVKALESFRGVWTGLLTDVMHALPQPQKELLSGDVTQMKSIPRGDRKLVQIDSIQTTYMPDLSMALNAPDLSKFIQPGGGPVIAPLVPQQGMDGMMEGDMGVQDPALGGGGMATPAAPAQTGTTAGATRGFLVTVKCLSPNRSGHALVQDAFVEALKKITPDPANPHKAYSVPKAMVFGAMQVKQDQQRIAKMRADYQAALQAKAQQQQLAPPTAPRPGTAGFFGRNPVAVPAAQPGQIDPNDNTPFLDRLLGEDVRDDWEVTVVFLVQLDPPPYAPPAPTEGTTPTAAAGSVTQ
jgi:type IV pilus assembly protein PilM